MTNQNFLYSARKIFCEILKFPYKVLIGFYNPEYQKKLEEKRELENRINSLDYKLELNKSEKEELACRALKGIDLNRRIKDNHKSN
ncbi:hypothetical protein HYS72_03435 [Candidatus Pacearchaeota archaeon]|nr:hypothetical protein [Candidatus Pacearchaeota archaeon]MBI2056930.1 hypothetical protein [Candidatus Pacearchaeota archaeon]